MMERVGGSSQSDNAGMVVVSINVTIADDDGKLIYLCLIQWYAFKVS